MKYKRCVTCGRKYIDYTDDNHREACSTICERKYISTEKIKTLLLMDNLRRIRLKKIKIPKLKRNNESENTVLRLFHENGLFPKEQYRIGKHLADFVFQREKIVVELDGSSHSLNKDTVLGKKDCKRNEYYIKNGWIVVIIKYRYNHLNNSYIEEAIKRIKRIVNGNKSNIFVCYKFLT